MNVPDFFDPTQQQHKHLLRCALCITLLLQAVADHKEIKGALLVFDPLSVRKKNDKCTYTSAGRAESCCASTLLLQQNGTHALSQICSALETFRPDCDW